MEMLTSINLELVTQLKQVTQSQINLNILINQTTAGNNSEITTTSTFERILNLTQEFINILNVVAGAPNTPHTPLAAQVPQMTTWIGGAYGGYASGSESASNSAYDSEINSPSDNSSITHYSPASASMSPQMPSPTAFIDNDVATPTANPNTDSATVLLIITCYVHILRLHVVLFWHVQHDLQPTSDADKSHRVCHFGNLPLQSGNLQVTMLIQLVASAFERMEALLGLPSDLCLGTCDRYDVFDDGQQQPQQQQPTSPYLYHDSGMLGAAGLLDVAKTIIGKEDLGRPDVGKGGIRSLRWAMVETSHLLQNRLGV
ncbi:hypothetical protein PG991_000888 [Apiospora marii]|uniref:Uncharacterized protein n=2 Tax=Apiospora marii TaxID=335849 RepID=A0ABR1ST94_9PEZI